jgi:hypothetical protein
MANRPRPPIEWLRPPFECITRQRDAV